MIFKRRGQVFKNKLLGDDTFIKKGKMEEKKIVRLTETVQSAG
jgi:hypothetical protein